VFEWEGGGLSVWGGVCLRAVEFAGERWCLPGRWGV
jgi:hypothetical protein